MLALEPVRRALSEARTQEALSTCVSSALHDGAALHPLRALLLPFADTAATTHSWSITHAARTQLSRIDHAIDEQFSIRLQQSPTPTQTLDEELARCQSSDRIEHTLRMAWSQLPPAARAGAIFVDLLRVSTQATVRLAIYHLLIEKHVDPRGPLTDDRQLSAEQRLLVLQQHAQQLEERGKLRPVEWMPAPERTLARTLADWSQYATHPRHLAWGFLHATKSEESSVKRLNNALGARPIPPEVRAWLERLALGGPEEVQARPHHTGRFLCGVCGFEQVHLVHRRASTDEDPLHGYELEYRCSQCETQYFSSWEDTSLLHFHEVLPTGWVVL